LDVSPVRLRVFAFVGMGLVSPLSSTAAEAAREISDFVVYLWGSPEVEDAGAKARALSEAGFTVVDWEPENLDALLPYGLKAMVHDPTPELASRLATHPALWGYHCGDEPYPEDQFPPLAERFRALKKADPHHPAFVNMLSTTGEFLRTYLNVVKPEILSFDYYQWWWGSDRYFEKLEQFREAALLARVPLGSCIEASANPAIERGDPSYLPDNAAKLRQSLYTNLAYGVRAVEWFSSRIVFETKSTKLTPSGRDVAALNAELKNLGPVLVTLRSQDVYHTPPLAAGTRAAPKEHWVQLIGEEAKAGLVLGTFKDPAGADYLLVANRDYERAQSVVVRLQSKWLGIAPWHKPKLYRYGIEKFDKASGGWTTISSSSFVGFNFVIGAADGELFRVTTQVQP
jgi:hypothetical protein